MASFAENRFIAFIVIFDAKEALPLIVCGGMEVSPRVVVEFELLLLLLLPQATKDSPMNASPKVLKKLFLFMIILLRK